MHEGGIKINRPLESKNTIVLCCLPGERRNRSHPKRLIIVLFFNVFFCVFIFMKSILDEFIHGFPLNLRVAFQAEISSLVQINHQNHVELI